MSWRFRKSINIGLGFRVNISKNGIGYSWGIPGYRKTWKANGPENELFVKKVKAIRVKNFITWIIGIATIFIWIFLVTILPKPVWISVLLALSCLICVLCSLINSHRFIFLEYKIDKGILPLIEKRNQTLSYLFNSSEIWNIDEYERVTYSRVNAGAGTNIKRSNVFVKFYRPPK